MHKKHTSNRIFHRPDYPSFYKGLDRIFRLFPDLTVPELSRLSGISIETIRNWKKAINKINRKESSHKEVYDFYPHWYSVYNLLSGLDCYIPDRTPPLRHGMLSLDLLFNGPIILSGEAVSVTGIQIKLHLCSKAMDTLLFMDASQRHFLEALMQIPTFLPKILTAVDDYAYDSLSIKQDLRNIQCNISIARAEQVKQFIWTSDSYNRRKHQLLQEILEILREFIRGFPQNIEAIIDMPPLAPYAWIPDFNFSAGLSRLMKKKGMTAAEFAELFGVSVAAVRSWLLYKNQENTNQINIPTLETITRICDYFDVDMDYLFYLTNWTQRENWCIAEALGFQSEETILWLAGLDDTPSETMNDLLTCYWDSFSKILDKLTVYQTIALILNHCPQCEAGEEPSELMSIFLEDHALKKYFTNFLNEMDHSVFPEDFLLFEDDIPAVAVPLPDGEPCLYPTEDPSSEGALRLFPPDPVLEKYGPEVSMLAYDFELLHLLQEQIQKGLEEDFMSLFSKIIANL